MNDDNKYRVILESLLEKWNTIASEQALKRNSGGRGMNLMVIQNLIDSAEKLKEDRENTIDSKLLGEINGFLIRLKTYKNIYYY